MAEPLEITYRAHLSRLLEGHNLSGALHGCGARRKAWEVFSSFWAGRGHAVLPPDVSAVRCMMSLRPHVLHSVAPEAEYLPEGQALHSATISRLLALPRGQARHSTAPSSE